MKNFHPASRSVANKAVLDVLEALSSTGMRWAVLHGEDALARGHTESDIDIVVDRSPYVVHATLAPLLVEQGIHPILAWANDVGAVTLFVLSADHTHRVQLDVTCDPKGRGKYGFASGKVLQSAVIGKRWPRLTEVDTLLYEANKRLAKRDFERLKAIDVGRPSDLDELTERAKAIFPDPNRASCIVEALTQATMPSLPRLGIMYRVRTARRYLDRCLNPTGFWVHLADVGEGDRMQRALRHALPHVRRVHFRDGRPHSQIRTWIREVWPTRWRPGLVVSTGDIEHTPDPDLILGVDPGNQDALVRRMVHRTIEILARRAHLDDQTS